MLNEVQKICEKWYVCWCKSNKEIKDLVADPTKKYLQNLKYNIKRECIFHSILVDISFVLILSIKNKGVGGFG